MSDQYQLRTALPGWKGIEEDGSDTWGTLIGTYATLPEAMLAAGHPDPANWHTAVDIPDVLYIDWVLYFDKTREYDEDEPEYLTPRWAIEAPTVATDFTNLLTADVEGSLP